MRPLTAIFPSYHSNTTQYPIQTRGQRRGARTPELELGWRLLVRVGLEQVERLLT